MSWDYNAWHNNQMRNRELIKQREEANENNDPFSFPLRLSDYRTDPILRRAMRDISGQAGSLNEQANLLNLTGGEFLDQYRQMIDPSSAYNMQQQANLRGQIGDATSQLLSNQNQALSARGMGSGGLSSILGAAVQNRAGEQVRQGTLGLQDQALARAGTFGQMGLSGQVQAGNVLSSAGNLYSNIGSLASPIDSNRLKSSMFDAQASNQYNQYLKMAQYNDMQARLARERERQSGLLGTIGSGLGYLAGAPFGAGSVGAQIGYGIGSSIG